MIMSSIRYLFYNLGANLLISLILLYIFLPNIQPLPECFMDPIFKTVKSCLGELFNMAYPCVTHQPVFLELCLLLAHLR